VFCLIYYYFPKYGGKTFFTGPVRTIDDILGGNPEVDAAVEQAVRDDKVHGEEGKEVLDEK